MRDVALACWYAFCLVKGLRFVFAATAIFTDHWWTIVRGVIG